MNKVEIIKGIQDLEVRIDWINYEGNKQETVEITKQIETDNYWIDFEIEVTVQFDSPDFYEVYNVGLIDFKLSIKGESDFAITNTNLGWYFTEDEITNEINIEL
jgi:hypothetical protein